MPNSACIYARRCNIFNKPVPDRCIYVWYYSSVRHFRSIIKSQFTISGKLKHGGQKIWDKDFVVVVVVIQKAIQGVCTKQPRKVNQCIYNMAHQPLALNIVRGLSLTWPVSYPAQGIWHTLWYYPMERNICRPYTCNNDIDRDKCFSGTCVLHAQTQTNTCEGGNLSIAFQDWDKGFCCCCNWKGQFNVFAP